MSRKLVSSRVDNFGDNAYSILVSRHSWLLKDKPEIAVDRARLYVMTDSEGISGLSHSLANLKEDERRCIEFNDPQWSDYAWLRSSCDGRYIFFSHWQESTDGNEKLDYSTKWLAQDNELEGGRFKHVAFDGKDSSWGLLSRNGQVLCSSPTVTNVTRVYQIMEEPGKDPVAFMKCELNGWLRAFSGNGNSIIATKEGQLEIHNIGENAGKLACRIDVDVYSCACALNEDGSEAAFVKDGELRVIEVGNVVGDKINQPAIVAVNLPKSLGVVVRLVYSDGNKLHALHHGGSVSLFDPSTKKLVPIEVPPKGQKIVNEAISPDADYIATIQCVGKEEKKTVYRTTVKRKPTEAERKDLSGCETRRDEAAEQESRGCCRVV